MSSPQLQELYAPGGIEAGKPVDFMSACPPEIALEILSCGVLTSIDIRHLSLVSRTWAEIARHTSVWSNLARRWGLADCSGRNGLLALTPRTRDVVASLAQPLSVPEAPDPAPRPHTAEQICSEWRSVVCLMDLYEVLWTGHTLNGDWPALYHLTPVERTFNPRCMRNLGKVFGCFLMSPETGVLIAVTAKEVFLCPTSGGDWSMAFGYNYAANPNQVVAQGLSIYLLVREDGDEAWTSRTSLIPLRRPDSPTYENHRLHPQWGPGYDEIIAPPDAWPGEDPVGTYQGYHFLRAKEGTVMVTGPDLIHAKIWEIKGDSAQLVQTLRLPYCGPLSDTYMDWDSTYVFLGGVRRGNAQVWACRRSDGKVVWSSRGEDIPPNVPCAPDFPSLGKDLMFDFAQLECPWASRGASQVPIEGIQRYCPASVVWQCSRPSRDLFEHWAGEGRPLAEDTCVVVDTDEANGLLVFATSFMVVILQDYRQVLSDAHCAPRLAVCIYTISPWEDSMYHMWGNQIEPAVQVRNGRIFWLGLAPILLDVSHGPRRARDIRATILTHGPPGGYQMGRDYKEQARYFESTSAEMGPHGNELYTVRQAHLSDTEGGPTEIVQWDMVSVLRRRAESLLRRS